MPDFSPPFAPHVRGEYPEKTYDDDGRIDPVRILLSCSRCGDASEARCDSGRYREKVVKYALGHARCAGKIQRSTPPSS